MLGGNCWTKSFTVSLKSWQNFIWMSNYANLQFLSFIPTILKLHKGRECIVREEERGTRTASKDANVKSKGRDALLRCDI